LETRTGDWVRFATDHVRGYVADAVLIATSAMGWADLEPVIEALERLGLREDQDFAVLHDLGSAQMAANMPDVAPYQSPVPWLRVDIDVTGRATASLVAASPVSRGSEP
jgi:hypothetical protein